MMRQDTDHPLVNAVWSRLIAKAKKLCISAVGRLVHTVFHLEARPVSERGMFERNVQPHQNSAFLLAVLSVILSDDHIRCAAAEGDVGQVTYVRDLRASQHLPVC